MQRRPDVLAGSAGSGQGVDRGAHGDAGSPPRIVMPHDPELASEPAPPREIVQIAGDGNSEPTQHLTVQMPAVTLSGAGTPGGQCGRRWRPARLG
jgi:hypothetical protein